MITFEDLWQELRAHGSSRKREDECRELWESYPPEKRQCIYDSIHVKLSQNKFVHYDPLRAIRENAQACADQILSYSAYYARYGTTEERDGWQMANPTGEKVIYVKRVTGCKE